MRTWEEDVELAALAKRNWTVAAMARHLGRDPKTVRAYLRGDREPGARKRSAPEAFAPFERYVGLRLAEDWHLW
jgi:predicted transcriptional regulator